MKKRILIFTVFCLCMLSSCLYALNNNATNSKVIINFYYYGVGGGGPAEIEETRKIVQKFMNENPGVYVNIIRVPFATDGLYDYFKMLLNTAPTASDIDVLTVDSAWALNLKDNLLDLAKYTPKERINDFFPNVLKNYSITDQSKQYHLYAYPWYCDVGLLFYRKDLLKKYEIAPPQTWKELETAAIKIQESEQGAGNQIVGYLWQGYAYEGLTCNALEWIYSNDGGDIINKDKSITINNENAASALNMAKKWIGTISPPSVLYMKEDESLNLFKSGKAVFVRGWPFFYKACNRPDSAIKGRVGFVQIPKGKNTKNSGVLGGWGLAINKASTKKEYSYKLINYLLTNYALYNKAKSSSELPALKSFYKQKGIEKQFPVFHSINDAIANGFSRPVQNTYPNYSHVSKEFDLTVYSILNGKNSAKNALRDLASKLHSLGFKAINANNNPIKIIPQK